MPKMKMLSRYYKIEESVSNAAKRFSLPLLRYSFAIIYFWFGLLKLLGISPADELVARSIEWLNIPHFIIFLSLWEMVIGISFAIKKLNRLALVLFFLKIPGTFLPLFISPEDTFTIIPFGLSLEGQYIVKNLIMIAAAFVLVATLHGDEKFLAQNPENR